MIEKDLPESEDPFQTFLTLCTNQGQLEVSKLEKISNLLASASGASTYARFLRNSSRDDYGIFRNF